MVEFSFCQPQPGAGTLRLGDLAAVTTGLRAGGLAVLPTETGYMLAALASSEAALEHAFVVKSRDPALVMHVACSSLSMIETVAVLTTQANRLLAEFTPGPLSLILAKTPLLPERLVTVNGTVGIRVPDNAATLQIVAALGEPLTATSLNRSGQPPVRIDSADRTELAALDWPADQRVHVVEDPTSKRYDLPSTLIRLTGPAPEILRAGPVTEEMISSVHS